MGPYEMLIPLLTFLGTVALGGSLVAAKAARKDPLRARLREIGRPRQPAKSGRGGGGIKRALYRIGLAASLGRPSPNLKEDLARAGYFGNAAPTIYLGAKLLLLLMGLAGTGLLVAPVGLPPVSKTFFILAGTGSPFFVPNVIVSLRRAKRRREVRYALPDAVDLLEVCVSSGMGLDMAWNVVADEVRHVSRTLADEMALTNLEIHLGAPRVEAMRHLAERTDVDEISSLVGVLVQSERFGTSVAEALRAFTTSMREVRSSRAEEEAERMSVRLLFPMVLFIFPAMFIVLVGPAGIILARVLLGI